MIPSFGWLKNKKDIGLSNCPQTSPHNIESNIGVLVVLGLGLLLDGKQFQLYL